MRILVFLVGVWSVSLMIDGEHSGFSIDLMNAAAAEIGLNVQYERFDSFQGMLFRSQRNASV